MRSICFAVLLTALISTASWAAELTLGTIVSASLDLPGQQASYTFQGTPGQRLYYDALEGDFDAIGVRLMSPSGATVSINANSDSDVGPFTLLETGIYTIFIKGNGPVTGTYRFRVLDVAQQPELQFGTTISKTIDQPFGSDIYRFAGVPGTQLYFKGQGGAVPSSVWSLFGPNNEGLASSSFNGDMEVVLKSTGTYVLVLANNAPTTAPYTFEAHLFDTPTDPLVLGATVSGLIQKPGDQHLYTFSGTMGQRLFYDALETDFTPIAVRLFSPSGVNEFLNGNADSDTGPFTLTETGTYTVQIDGNGPTTGSYGFRLLDLGSATAVAMGASVNGQLSPRSRADLYQFAGTAGQRIRLDNISASGSEATWELVGLANQNLAFGSINQTLGNVVLPASGNYVILVAGNSPNTVPLNYQLRVSDVSEPPVALAGLDTVIKGNINAGSQDTSTFTAPAGTALYFDSLDRSNQNAILVELHDPDNVLVFNIGSANDAGPYVLLRSGTFTVVVKGNSPSTTGTYSFRLLNLGAVPSLPFNTTLTAALETPYKTDVYQFNGTAGQRLYYDSLQNDFENVAVRLWAPDGTYRYINGNADSDVGPFTLSVSGTYYLIFESNLTTPSSYSFRLLNADDQPALTLGAPITSTLDPGLSTILYRVAGTAGLHLFLNGTAPNVPGASWYFYGPNNEGLGSAGVGGYIETTLTASGTDLLLLSGTAATPIPFAFTLLNPDVAGPAPGQPLISSTSVSAGAVTLTWSAVAGKSYRVQFKASLSDGTWTDLTGDVSATGNSASKSDTTIGTAPRRFYRIKVL